MAPLRLLLTAIATASLVAFGSASQLPRNGQALSPNPPNENLIPLSAYTHGGSLSNAERMKRGMGLRKPKRRNDRRTLTNPSATPTLPEEPQPTPVTPLCTGRSGLIRSAPGQWLGMNMNAFGEYGTTSSRTNALKVTLCGDSGAFSIWATNSPMAELPFLGGISGYANTDDNMSQSSYNYAYVAATVQVANNSPAISGDNSYSRATGINTKVESAIWSLDSNNVFSVSWVNFNGDRVNAEILKIVSGTEESFVFTAGYQEYSSQFGPSQRTTFTFEESTVY